MTAKEAKAYLMQYRASLDRAREIAEHLDELKAEAVRLRDHEGQRVELDAAVARYVDACEESAHELDRLAALRAEIVGAIDGVTSAKYRTLLYWRYIRGYTWEQVAVEMSYSWRQTCRLHGDALNAVKIFLPCGEQDGERWSN